MQITDAAVSLNVADPAASADWMKRHLGFTETMAAEGFVAVRHPDAAFSLTYLAVGLPTFKPARVAGPAGDGLLLAFVVPDVDAEHDRLVAEDVEVLTPPETEPWGERYSQYLDPNGIVVQLVTWETTGA